MWGFKVKSQQLQDIIFKVIDRWCPVQLVILMIIIYILMNFKSTKPKSSWKADSPLHLQKACPEKWSCFNVIFHFHIEKLQFDYSFWKNIA